MRSQKIRNRAPRPFKMPGDDSRWKNGGSNGPQKPSARALALVTRRSPENTEGTSQSQEPAPEATAPKSEE